MRERSGPVARIRGVAEEINGFLHRRRRRRQPRVRLYWANGTSTTLDPESEPSGRFLELAELLLKADRDRN